MIMNAPVILFAYNRPLHTQKAIASLRKNAEAETTELFIYADAAPDEAGQAAVEATRSGLRNVQGFSKVTLIERQTNYGLARNVIEGVTEVVERYGRVIVLEDDLVVSPYFLRFMNDALRIYEDEPMVGHIQACDFTNNPLLPPTFLIEWTGSWGWATWKRAWEKFNPDGKQLLKALQKRGLSRRFDFGGSYPFTRMLRRQTQGKNNSWAIRWNASLFLQGMLSLNAGRSLVSNEGLDGSGTNSISGDPYHSRLWMKPLLVEKISPIAENLAARKILEDYYRRTNSLWARVKKRLLKYF